MTTTISVGDLVLRDGRAEEVLSLSPEGGFYWHAPQPSLCVHICNATRIGSTRDGWRISDGRRPVELGEHDFADVIWSDGHPSREKGWLWPSACMSIVAYRIVSRTTPTSAQPQTPSAETLKAVAAEMREVLSVAGGAQLRAWADRIDPPSFDPRLKVIQDAFGNPNISENGARIWMKDHVARRILDALDAHAKEAGR